MLNLTIDEIIDKHWLSVRSANVCKCNNITKLSDLLDHYITHNTFIEFDNCGAKSDVELIDVCKLYIDEYTEENQVELIPPIDLMATYNGFDPFKRSVFNRFFYTLFNKLSTRGINGLASLSGNYSSVQKYLFLFFASNTDFREIKNIGKKTKDELVIFKGQIQSFLLSIASLSSSELNKAYFKLVIQHATDQVSADREIDIDLFFTKNDRLHLFKLLKELIVKEQVYSHSRTRIFLSAYTLDHMQSMKKVADELQLTRERVRQLSKEIEENFSNTFNFIKNFGLSDCVEYGITKELELITVNNELADRLNKIDGVSFNPLFYAHVLHLFLGDEFTIFDPTDAELKRASINERSRQDNFYLILKKHFELFDFEGFMFDINSKCAERITDSYSLYFEGYLLDFFATKPDIKLIDSIARQCREILFTELDLVVDQTGYLVFERNIKNKWSIMRLKFWKK
jgi:hypothetical protein